MEISPDGKTLKPRSRFARFTNLPELQQMFRAFADVQTAEMLNLPRPRLEGGKPIVVACPMSEEQRRSSRSWSPATNGCGPQKVDPREDNALAITTDGRKLALDARMLSPTAPDFPGSKVNALVENVAAIWQRTAATRGTQMIFCDMGVNPTPWGYSAYDEIIAKLVARGIPAEQIAAIGDADTDAKKQALFEKVRTGQVRVLIGSTQKMGTGTNVQKRLVALHHLDAPWKPAEVEQREGRILRQGNENEEVAIYRYVTEGSFDAYMWQALETKARFISQVMTRRQRRPPRRGHRRPGTVLRRGQGHRLGQPGRPDAGRGRRRAAAAHRPEEEPRRRAIPRPPQRPRPARHHRQLSERLAKLTADQATARPTPTTPSPSAAHRRPRRRCLDILAQPWTPCRSTSARRHAFRWASIGACVSASSCIRNAPPEVYLEGADHPPGHALPRPPRAARRPQRPGTAGRRLRLRMRPRPAGPGDRRGPAPRLPGPARHALPARAYLSD